MEVEKDIEYKEALQPLLEKMDLAVSNDNPSAMFHQLEAYIDHLIKYDFNKLIGILYRVDVSEQVVRRALADNKEGRLGATIVTELLLRREAEKVKTRALYRQKRLMDPDQSS